LSGELAGTRKPSQTAVQGDMIRAECGRSSGSSAGFNAGPHRNRPGVSSDVVADGFRMQSHRGIMRPLTPQARRITTDERRRAGVAADVAITRGFVFEIFFLYYARSFSVSLPF